MTAPHLRAGTVDRQHAVDRLTRHFTDGRLDAAEFDERVGKAYAAVHLDELPALFTDLPEDEQSRGRRPAQGWSVPDRPYSGAGSDPWPGMSGPFQGRFERTGQQGPPFRRPPRILLVVMLALALMFSIGALTHGFFPFPLIWIALGVFIFSRSHRRRRWTAAGQQRGGR